MDLDKVKDHLKERKAELQDRLDRLARHTRHREEPLPQDFAEQAVELENQELMEALDTEIADEVRQIERALVRIEEDEYLYCAGCGEDIPEARLQAIPTTQLCVDCASEAERA